MIFSAFHARTYEETKLNDEPTWKLTFLMIRIFWNFLLSNLFFCGLTSKKKVDNQKDINSNFRNINLNRRRFECFFYIARSCLLVLPVKTLKETRSGIRKKINLCRWTNLAKENKCLRKLAVRAKSWTANWPLFTSSFFWIASIFFTSIFSFAPWRLLRQALGKIETQFKYKRKKKKEKSGNNGDFSKDFPMGNFSGRRFFFALS